MRRASSQATGLRSSCDKCHQTKLKCVSSTTGSGCHRCTNLNLPCVYSPPGRSGRVPAAERRAKGDKKAVTTPPRNRSPGTQLQSPGGSGGEMLVHSSGQSSSDEARSTERRATTPEDTFQADPMIGGIDFVSGSSDANIMLESSFDMRNMMEIDLSIPPMPMPSTFDMLSPTTAVSDFAATTMVAEPMPDVGRMVFDNSHSHSHLPIMDTQQQPPALSSSQCECFRSIVAALQHIQDPAVRSCSLDAMLSRNKKALVAICNSLSCASSHDGTTRLVTLVVIQRALYLYRIIYQSRLQERHSSMRREPDAARRKDGFSYDESARKPKSAADASKGRLSLGTYQLDSADEHSLTKQILILDLNKIPRLLERLDRRAYGPDDPDGLDLYNILRSALVTDFRSLAMQAAAHP